MALSREQLEEKAKTHEDVWGYRFKVANSKNDRRKYHLPPTRGQIIEEYGYGYLCFVPYGKTGQLLKSKKRSMYQTIVVETEKEAIANYNLLIEQRIKEHENQINELKSLLK